MKRILLVCISMLMMTCLTNAGLYLSKEDDKIVFMGKVIRVAPGHFVESGTILSYRLIKYRVERVCSGSYDKAEIVVDHLLLDGSDLESVKPGAVLCVSVKKSKDISFRNNSPGIREPSDKIEEFYIGPHEPLGSKCPCN